MPYYRRAPYSRRRTFVRRRYLDHIPRPFPRVMNNMLRYHCSGTLDPAVGGQDSKVIQVNNMYDPEIGAAVGHQPLGYDELTEVYGNWLVRRCSVRVTPRVAPSTGTGSIVPTIIKCFLYGEATTPSFASKDHLYEFMAERNSKVLWVGGPSPAYESHPFYQRLEYDHNKTFGGRTRDDPSYWGAQGSGPTVPWYLHIVAMYPDGGLVNPGPIQYDCDLEFWASWFGLLRLNQS